MSAAHVVRLAILSSALASAAAATGLVIDGPIDLLMWKAPTFSHEGVQSIYLQTWRRPVLEVFWRADDPASTAHAVPDALKLAADHEGDLVVFLVECSGLKHDDMLRFACSRRWLLAPAIWTCQSVADTHLPTLPRYVLGSPEHLVLVACDPLGDRTALMEALDDALDERVHGAPGLPPAARAAWTDLHDGKFARALGLDAVADKLAAQDPHTAAVLHEQAQAIRTDLEQRFQLLNDMTLNGEACEAYARLKPFAAGFAGLPASDPLVARVTSLVDSQTCGEMPVECKANETLVKLRDRLLAKGPDASVADQLGKFAVDKSATRSAKRAKELAAFARP